MFPNAASVVALVDRLTENCELVQIEGPSYRTHPSLPASTTPRCGLGAANSYVSLAALTHGKEPKACQQGIRTLCLPERNKSAIAELTLSIRRLVDIRYVKPLDEASISVSTFR